MNIVKGASSLFMIFFFFAFQYDFGGKDVDALEFGLMTDRDSASKVFTIKNPNPVQVSQPKYYSFYNIVCIVL